MLILQKTFKSSGSLIGFALRNRHRWKEYQWTLQSCSLSSGNIWLENMGECTITCTSGLLIDNMCFEYVRLGRNVYVYKYTRAHTHKYVCACVCVCLSLVSLLFVPVTIYWALSYAHELFNLRFPTALRYHPFPLTDVRGMKHMIQCLRSSLWQGVDQSPVKWLSGLLPNRWHKASEVRIPTLVCVQTLHQNFPRLGRTQIGLWNQCLDLWLFIINSFLKVICPREQGLSGRLEGSLPPLSQQCPLLTIRALLQPSQVSSVVHTDDCWCSY